MPEGDWNKHQVTLGKVSYPYFYGYDCVDRITDSLGRYDADTFLVVTDDTVLATHGEYFLRGLARHASVEILSRPAGEEMKNLATLSEYVEQAINAGASRRSVVVAFGGGVPGNLAGLLAGVLFRGVRLVHVPTTTVAAMDSTVSLKQAVNSGQGKNHVGTYHRPEAVFTDVKLLQTLPEREMRSGLCEATKNCLAIRPGAIPTLRERLAAGSLDSPETLLWLLEESLRAKSQVTREDSKEQANGLVLEYGHTVGHAVELCDLRLRGTEGISHGEAVAFGMVTAARISARLHGLGEADVALHDELVNALGAPVRVPAGLQVPDIMNVIVTDNKRGYLKLRKREVAMVLLQDLGSPMGRQECPLVAVDLGVVEETVAALAAPEPGPLAEGRTHDLQRGHLEQIR